jgi:hypothetical protein
MNTTTHGITYQMQNYLHVFVLLGAARIALEALAAKEAA